MCTNKDVLKTEACMFFDSAMELAGDPRCAYDFFTAMEEEPGIAENFEHVFAVYLLWKECRKKDV